MTAGLPRPVQHSNWVFQRQLRVQLGQARPRRLLLPAGLHPDGGGGASQQQQLGLQWRQYRLHGSLLKG